MRDEVWQLYAEAVATSAPRATMIEWDADVPAFEALEGELGRAARWETAALGGRRDAA